MTVHFTVKYLLNYLHMYEFTTKKFYGSHRSMVKQSETLELDLYEISTIYADRHVIMTVTAFIPVLLAPGFKVA